MSSLDLEIPSYELVRPLGQGGAASVGLYKHRALERLAAVKFFMNEPIGWRSFKTEALALGGLSGIPNVTDVYDAGVTSSGIPYLVMPYYSGPSVQRLCAHGGMQLVDALRIARLVGAALAELHSRSMVHGDIKPSNILTDSNGAPYLADFGTASLANWSNDHYAFTPAFAAPELLSGNPAPSPASDTYSMAATVWAMLEGHPPRVIPESSNTVLDMLTRARNGTPRLKRAGVPADLQSVLHQALSTDPDARPTSSEFSRRLQGLVLHDEDGHQAPHFPSSPPASSPGAPGLAAVVEPWGQTILRSVAAVALPPLNSKISPPSPASTQTSGIVAILTAIPEEMTAVARHLDGRRTVTTQHGLVYTQGEFSANGNSWRVICACVGPGNMSAALVTQQTALVFEPDLLAFIGVAGGIKDVKKGDVVVASRIIGYEGGKDSSRGFLPRPAILTTDFRLMQHCTQVSLSRRWRSRIPRAYRGDSQVFIKPLVAGEKVLANRRSQLVADIRRNHSDAVAVEMEGIGMYSAASFFQAIPAVSIRGVSDLLAGKRGSDDEHWQPRAAASAAAFFFEALSSLTRQQLSRPHSRQAFDSSSPDAERPEDWVVG